MRNLKESIEDENLRPREVAIDWKREREDITSHSLIRDEWKMKEEDDDGKSEREDVEERENEVDEMRERRFHQIMPFHQVI